MKHSIFFIMTLIALLLAACGGEGGSGNLITEDREVSGFERVELAGEGELTLTQGGTESLTIEAEDNVMPQIKSEVRNGTLVIGLDSGWWDRVEPTKPIKFDLTVKDLAGLSLSGSGSINSANLNTEDMDLTVSGSGRVQIANLATEDMDLTLSGSGRIEVANLAAKDLLLDLSGSGQVAIGTLSAEKVEGDLGGSGKVELAGLVSEQKITVSGSANYRAAELESQEVEVEVSGAGEVAIWATESLDVEINGSGEVDYVGAPTLTQDISGSGRVTRLNQ
ncbi:MAG: head GIN domain-containing protein [Ardenticatenaceae bacterium]